MLRHTNLKSKEMKRLFATILTATTAIGAKAQNRFPKPDFESGYEYPDLQYAVPNELMWDVIDVVLLLALLASAAWAITRRRKPTGSFPR